MMSSRVIVVAAMVLLASLAISEGMSLRSLGVELHCRCIKTESKHIGRFIEKVEIISGNSHCKETEIIATLKNTGEEVCLDPKAPWVKKVVDRMMSKRR
ncbi:interleukin-8-like isoform X2 [Hippoglossus hippoglossus]|uniref:interleukin-8-like isoform X2 n=1 Tax=Hippoglossus hippoglossus TaxID=8267 RepID=UPI00148C031C|nr:interleukin-8-like isoform X2 [Hippoglossus hippoglossus]